LKGTFSFCGVVVNPFKESMVDKNSNRGDEIIVPSAHTLLLSIKSEKSVTSQVSQI